MRYEQPPSMTRQELEDAFRSTSGERIRDALISAFYSEDGSWVAGWCLKLSAHPEWAARRGAAIVLGNMAVIRRDGVDLMKCLEAMERLAADQNEEVRAAAKDSLNDVLLAIRRTGVS